jgi:hypothetical protein
MFGMRKKNGPILQQPQVWGGNECLLIGNWMYTKMNITSLEMGCKGHVK